MSSNVIYPAQPEQILKGLSKLWTSFGKEEKEQGKPTVLRACAMTLIIVTDEEDRGFSASQMISELMHEHPSRGIVIAISDTAERDIEARVLAQCWKPFGKAQQICCEQIEITARPDSWPNVAPTLTGLIAADLPVVLWCRNRAALSPLATRRQISGLKSVMNLSTKVIVDTLGEELREAFELIQEWRSKGRIIADLEWARLTAWRQPLAQIFDNAARTNRLESFKDIDVSYSGSTPCASVLYLAAWLSAPYHANISFLQADPGGENAIRGITLRSDSETIEFTRDEKECATLRSTNGRQRKYSLTVPPLHSLMNEELGVIGADPSFDAIFPVAQELLRGR